MVKERIKKILNVPVVNHEFLNGEERLVADVGIVVREQAHHERLASQLFQNAKKRKLTIRENNLL